jgi:hypothetical protein
LRGDVIILGNLAVHETTRAAESGRQNGVWFLSLPRAADVRPIGNPML